MDPTDSQDFDIFLQINSQIEPNIANMNEGDFFKFQGKMNFIGNEEYPHVLEALRIDTPTNRLDFEKVKGLPFYVFKKVSRMFSGKSI